MPIEADYEFGKRAVKLGHLVQDQLDECVEVLVALERAGSSKRIWDVIARKGYMAGREIAAIRGGIKEQGVPLDGLGRAKAIEDEERSDELNFPPPESGTFSLVCIAGGKAKIYPLPLRSISVGKDPENDIVLDALESGAHAAEISAGHGRYRVLSRSQSDLLVNDQRVRVRELKPNDLIELGAAKILYVAANVQRTPDGSLPPAATDGMPAARLRIVEGPHKATTFPLGETPVIIGSHMLANGRIADASVAEFHAHVAFTPEGYKITDLKGFGGTLVNGVAASRQVLKTEDNISIGACQLVYECGGKTRETGKGAVAQPEAESRLHWDVPEDVEVEPATDPLIQAGLKPIPQPPAPDRPFKAYKLNQLHLVCVEGPLENHRFPLKKASTAIGRDKANCICIDDVSVSRWHAEVVLGAKHPEVRDLDSRNGTYVNGHRVSSQALRSGDTIRVGKCLFVVEESLGSKRKRG